LLISAVYLFGWCCWLAIESSYQTRNVCKVLAK